MAYIDFNANVTEENSVEVSARLSGYPYEPYRLDDLKNAVVSAARELSVNVFVEDEPPFDVEVKGNAVRAKSKRPED